MDARRRPRPVPRGTPASLRYRRVLLKLSGEALMGEARYGIDADVLHVDRRRDRGSPRRSASSSRIVIGGGNIFRGVRGSAPRAWTAPPPTTWACWRR